MIASMTPQAEELFNTHRAWAHGVARSFAARRGIRGFDADALESEADFALWQAATRFDPLVGKEFKAFASCRLLGGMRESHYRQPGIRSLRKLGLRVVSINEPVSKDDERCAEYADSRALQPFALIDAKDEVQAALASLKPMQRTVLILEFFEGLNQADTARRMKRSASHVYRLDVMALKEARQHLLSQYSPRYVAGRRASPLPAIERPVQVVKVSSGVTPARTDKRSRFKELKAQRKKTLELVAALKNEAATRRRIERQEVKLRRVQDRQEQTANRVVVAEQIRTQKAEQRRAQQAAKASARAEHLAHTMEQRRIQRAEQQAAQRKALATAQLAASAPPMAGIRSLEPRMQEILRLTTEEGFTVRQIAERFGLPFKKAKKLCVRAVIEARRAAQPITWT